MYRIDCNFSKIKFVITTEKHHNYIEQKKHINQFYIPNVNFTQQEVREEVNLRFVEDKILYNEYLERIRSIKGKNYQSFENQIHKEVQLGNGTKGYLIDDLSYVCLKTKDGYFIISDGRKSAVKWLFRIIREIIVRKNEDEKALFMHGTGICLNDKGILFLGNQCAGKTTITSKIFSDQSNETKLLSNDRVFLFNEDADITMDYFPIPVVYAIGTVKNDKFLDEYFKTTSILEKRTGKKYETALNSEKVDVPLTHVPSIYKGNTELESKSKVDQIIFSNIVPGTSFEKRDLTFSEKWIGLEKTCFTIFDWESLRMEWIRRKITSIDEIIENKYNIFHQLIDGTEMARVSYGYNIEPKTLSKQINRL